MRSRWLEVELSNETKIVKSLRDEVMYVYNGKQRLEMSLLDGDSHGNTCFGIFQMAENTLWKFQLANCALGDDSNDVDYSSE